MIIDGSITKEVAYDIDASGNALVVIRSNEPTTVYTSYDFGATWSSCNLTDPALDEGLNAS